MHTIKGGAGFLGLEPIVETANKAEDILGKLRNAEFVISPAINDLLLKAADKIREYLEKAENQEELEPDNELLSQLEDVLKNQINTLTSIPRTTSMPQFQRYSIALKNAVDTL
jgi:two-component system chemotaxis sensor kinase CheA